MLKNIDPLLGPDLLRVLCEMGHGDEIAVVDANFTARRLAAGKPIVRLDGIGLRRACQAVLSVLPLDQAVSHPVGYMKVCHTAADFVAPVQAEVLELLRTHDDAPVACDPIERFAFYERVRDAFAFVQTGELRPYGNFIFKKGVLAA